MNTCSMAKWFSAKGAEAARIRQRKYALARKYGIPEDLVGGSLALTHRRCGKPTCHCAEGQGHPMWSLTFMVGGKKRVERIPTEWVEQLRPLVEEGRTYKQAVGELMSANAELLVLRRKEAGSRKAKTKTKAKVRS